MDLKQLDKICDYIEAAISRELPLQQLRMFLLVAIKDREGVSQPEIGDALNMPQGTVSHNVARLSVKIVEGVKGFKAIGYGLIVVTPDPDEPRRNLLHLSPKGKNMTNGIKRLLREG